MTKKNRPQYIEKQLQEINDILREKRLKYEDHYDDALFVWFTQHLLHHNWYRGFNMYYDIPKEDGTILRALAGANYEDYDYYIQIW